MALIFVLLFSSAVRADQTDPADPVSLIAGVRPAGPIDFCGEPVPIEQQHVKERLEKELLLSLWNRPQVILWLKRYSRYMPHIETMLADENMPDDLKYIAVIESALRPHVGSPKGAVGFWQFLKSTGRNYGLTIDSRKDERRNLFDSTEAAIAYFKALYMDFGSWTLSAAAYNMGEEGLKAEIIAQEVNDYYTLYLSLETQRYIFRAIAAKMILSSPEKYGFFIMDEDRYPLLEFDLVEVSLDQDVALLVAAKAAGTDFKTLKDLNPEIRGHYLQKGRHRVRIPKGCAKQFNTRYEEASGKWLEKQRQRIYIVQKGDHLSAIAQRFNVPLPLLFIWNRLKVNQVIHPGDRLIIYPGRDSDFPAAKAFE